MSTRCTLVSSDDTHVYEETLTPDLDVHGSIGAEDYEGFEMKDGLMTIYTKGKLKNLTDKFIVHMADLITFDCLDKWDKDLNFEIKGGSTSSHEFSQYRNHKTL